MDGQPLATVEIRGVATMTISELQTMAQTAIEQKNKGIAADVSGHIRKLCSADDPNVASWARSMYSGFCPHCTLDLFVGETNDVCPICDGALLPF